jgi:hypothetical protein
LIAVPVYNPDTFSMGAANGMTSITAVKIIGLFVDSVQGASIVGYLMPYPSVPREGTSATPAAAFVVSFALVR